MAFYGGKGTGYEGGFRCPAMIRWPGHIPADRVENGIISASRKSTTHLIVVKNENEAFPVGDLTEIELYQEFLRLFPD
jgi:arylsulfatase